MNLRLNILLILITLGLGGWAYYLYGNGQEKDLSQLIKQEGEAEYVGNKISTMMYDLQGKPQYFALADEIKRFESTERTEFIKPLVELFDISNGVKQWKLSADQAEMTKDRMLHLNGNVILQSLDETTRLQRIETARLTIDLTTQDITTDSEVKSQGLGLTTTGIGLNGNLKKQIATLLQNVKTSLEPTVIQQSPSQTERQKD